MNAFRTPIASCLAAALLLGCAGFARAATEEEIEAARKKGIEFLQAQQGSDGSWFYNGHAVGITALGGLSLIENGVPLDDKSVELAHSFVRGNLENLNSTYDLALAILFLSRVGDRDNRTPIRDMAARLVSGQNVEGGWSYTCPLVNAIVLTNKAERPEPPEGAGDNSCTQFGTLGMWVSSRWGVNIDDTMENVGTRFIDTQMEDGGWAYNHAAETPASGPSMTYAGLFCLTVSRANKIRAEQDQERTRTGAATSTAPAPAASSTAAATTTTADNTEGETLIEDPVFSKGLEKAGAFAAGINAGQARYFLWSVERLGVLLDMPTFGTTDWFDKGADALVKSQREDGAWENPNKDWGNIADTAFAILFLRKANLGSDISRLLKGEPDKKFMIYSREDRPEFLKLTEALAEAKEGEIIRISGNGPFDMPHIEIDKSISIEAAPGYTPAFRYDIGYDATGKRSRPEDDPNARFMVRVNKGTLTLEGLELQTDPPTLSKRITWNAIVLNGGNLRMLNCSIAEVNKQGSAAVHMAQPGEATLRNCLLVGGRAGIDILTTGAQKVRLENTVVYSQLGINAVTGPAGENTRLTLELDRSVMHCKDVFSFPKLTNLVDIVSMGSAYKADFLGSTLLRSSKGHDGVTWTGEDNVYDVGRWVGAQASIKDDKTWNALWGGADKGAQKKLLPMLGRLRQEAFTHSVRGEDFEFDPESAAHQLRKKSGVNALIIGPGDGFTRYRESFEYREWEEKLVAEAAPM